MWLFGFHVGIGLYGLPLSLLVHVSYQCLHGFPSLVYLYLCVYTWLISLHVASHLWFTGMFLNISVHMALHFWYIATSI